jgi:hypothetical protein
MILDKKLIEKYGDDYIHIITELLIKNGKDNSGKLVESLNGDLKQVAEDLIFIIKAEDYFTYVDEGRKPGTYPNIGAIREWTSLKGIDESAVWPIAQSIFKFGIEPTNIIEKSIKQIEEFTVKKLEDDMTKDNSKLVNDIVDKINKIEIKE